MCFLLSQDANRKRSKEDVVKFMTEMHEEGGDDQSLVVDRTIVEASYYTHCMEGNESSREFNMVVRVSDSAGVVKNGM